MFLFCKFEKYHNFSSENYLFNSREILPYTCITLARLHNGNVFISSYMDDDDKPEMQTKMAAVMFHALVALVKAGPCSTQRDLMGQIREHRSPNIEEYAKVCNL